jgi:phage repressor protein C with HTH and peptisase S24 domain
MHIKTERLYQAAKLLGGIEGQSTVAAALGESSQTVNNWEARGVSKMGALKAQSLWGCSATWILTGEGSMKLAAAPTAAIPPQQEGSGFSVARVRSIEAPATVPIRKVQLSLRAGITGYETELEPDDGGIYEMPVDVIDELSVDPQWLLAIRVKGDSMKPMMLDKELVVVSRKHIEPVDEMVFALNFKGEAVLKQLVQRGDDWYLHSFNNEHRDINVRSGPCEIVGMVVYQPPRILHRAKSRR